MISYVPMWMRRNRAGGAFRLGKLRLKCNSRSAQILIAAPTVIVISCRIYSVKIILYIIKVTVSAGTKILATTACSKTIPEGMTATEL